MNFGEKGNSEFRVLIRYSFLQKEIITRIKDEFKKNSGVNFSGKDVVY